MNKKRIMVGLLALAATAILTSALKVGCEKYRRAQNKETLASIGEKRKVWAMGHSEAYGILRNKSYLATLAPGESAVSRKRSLWAAYNADLCRGLTNAAFLATLEPHEASLLRESRVSMVHCWNSPTGEDLSMMDPFVETAHGSFALFSDGSVGEHK